MPKILSWQDPHEVGAGRQVSVAMNSYSGKAIMVYVKTNSDRLCYRIGTLAPGAKRAVWAPEYEYEVGYYPSVSINNHGVVVSVQETNNAVSRRMFYRVGVLVGDTVQWGSEFAHYDTGYRPSVSINDDNELVEVHQSANIFFGYELFSWYGKVDPVGKSVQWISNQKFSTGANPNISLDRFGSFLIVQKSRGDARGLWYRTGKIDADRRLLQFNPENPTFDETGWLTTAARNDFGDAVQINTTAEVLRSHTTQSRTLDIHNDGTVTFADPLMIGYNSAELSVAFDNQLQVLLVGRFSTGPDPAPISSRVGNGRSIWSNWMEQIAPQIGNKNLRSLILPGTHDSGTSSISSAADFSPDADWKIRLQPRALVSLFARAQAEPISTQLEAGIRYFDLRVAPARSGPDSRFRFVHALWGDMVDTAIDAIARFLNANQKEIVVLDFQHFFDMKTEDYYALAAKIQRTIGSWLISPQSPTGLQINELWRKSQRVVVLFNTDNQDVFISYPQIWRRNQYIHSPWPNTENIDTLHQKLDEYTLAAPPDKLFVLQCQLTPFIESWVTLRSLEYLASQYNKTVMGEWIFGQWRSRPLNILMFDFANFGEILPIVKLMNMA